MSGESTVRGGCAVPRRRTRGRAFGVAKSAIITDFATLKRSGSRSVRLMVSGGRLRRPGLSGLASGGLGGGGGAQGWAGGDLVEDGGGEHGRLGLQGVAEHSGDGLGGEGVAGGGGEPEGGGGARF